MIVLIEQTESSDLQLIGKPDFLEEKAKGGSERTTLAGEEERHNWVYSPHKSNS